MEQKKPKTIKHPHLVHTKWKRRGNMREFGQQKREEVINMKEG